MAKIAMLKSGTQLINHISYVPLLGLRIPFDYGNASTDFKLPAPLVAPSDNALITR